MLGKLAEKRRMKKHRPKLVMGLEKLYEDKDIIVLAGPHENEVLRLVLEALEKARKPVKLKELRKQFSGIVGEDRLRRALRRLVNDGLIVQLNRSTYIHSKYLE